MSRTQSFDSYDACNVTNLDEIMKFSMMNQIVLIIAQYLFILQLSYP